MLDKNLNTFMWTEKYRPDSISQMILPKSYKTFFTKLINGKDIPHCLLHSSNPGSGKTTLAKCLVKDLGADYLYINASKDTGIDTLRNDIQKFAVSKSFSGKSKIVILDEIDGSHASGLQPGLRAFMEEYHKTCKFILTCNYITKVIEPIQSRCKSGLIDFNFSDKKYQDELKPKILKRLEGILKNENIEYENDVLIKIIDKYYPDIRKIIGILQQFSISNGIINKDIFNIELIDKELYDLILNKKFTAARKFILDKNYSYDELYTKFFNEFVPLLEKEKQGQIIIMLAEYAYRNSFVIDKELNFCASILEIISLLD